MSKKRWKGEKHFSSKLTRGGSAIHPDRMVHPEGTWLGEPVPEICPRPSPLDEGYSEWLRHQQNMIYSSFELPPCMFRVKCPENCSWDGQLDRCPSTMAAQAAKDEKDTKGWRKESEEGLF